jgi:hypothetical protein
VCRKWLWLLKLDVGCSMDSVSRDMCIVMRGFAGCFGVYFSYGIFERLVLVFGLL